MTHSISRSAALRDRRAAVALCLAAGLWLPAAASGSPTAEYSVTLDTTWSATSHPVGFPADPHLSPLVGATHDADVSFWAPGGLASDGIEYMAETGITSPLADEIQIAINAGDADALILGDGIPESPGSVSTSFAIDRDQPLVTLVSMVAPSPDWFVGVHDLSLLDGGDWVDEQVVVLFAYDAGTDSGSTYTAQDQDTSPADPIALISTLPLGNGNPVGTFTFTRTDAPPGVPVGGGVGAAMLALSLALASIAAHAMRRRRTVRG